MPKAKKNHPSFSSSRIFQKLASQATSREYVKGQVIFAEGNAADAMFRIEQGNVKLAIATSRSRKATIAILRPGDCFGEGCLVRDSLRTFSATSIDQSKIGRIGSGAMKRRLHQDPGFAKLFISYLLLRVGRVEDDLVDQLMNSSERRLARLLLQLSDFGGIAGRSASVANIDQGTLAQVVGTTRSRVSHFMNQFRKKGFIDYNGRLRINKSLVSFLLADPQ
jgi:CRP/FNR family transcriptional regulator, cyclic AMP receptor protein